MDARTVGKRSEGKRWRSRRGLRKVVLVAAGLMGAGAVAGPATAQPSVGRKLGSVILAVDPDQREWERKQKQKEEEQQKAAALKASGGASAKVGSSDAVVRKGPGNHFASSGRVQSGKKVSIVCQTKGSKVSGPTAKGSPWWDKISGPTSGWVSDAFIKTGSTGRVARACRSNEVPHVTQARTGPPPARPGQECHWGARQKRFVSADIRHAPDASFVRLSLQPYLCKQSGLWATSNTNPLVLTDMGSGKVLGISLELDAPHAMSNGVEWGGRVRMCPPASVGSSVGVGVASAGVSTGSGLVCTTVGKASVQATVAGGKVSYTWKMTTTAHPDLSAVLPMSLGQAPSLRELMWTNELK